MLDNNGKPLDANFSVDSDDGVLSVILESRGAGRNNDYSAALALILERLGALGAVLDSIHLQRARNEARPESERRVQPEGIPFPIDLSTVDDFKDLRRRISSAQAALGRKPGASGAGNGTKRIRMRLSALDIDPVELRATVGGFAAVAGDTSVSRSPLSVTSRDAVLTAVEEFDRIGRDAFLKKYGYRKAVSYFLAHDGRHYDTKAIIGAAFRYQHRLPPLGNDEFSGGKATVETALTRMKFRVEKAKELASPRRNRGGVGSDDSEVAVGHFAILAIPNVYDIERAIQVLELDTWTLDSNKVQVGDQIVIWKAQGKGQRRGIVAFAEVVGGVEQRPPFPGSEEFFVGEPEVGTARRFLMRYQVPDGLPLWLGASDEADAVLESLSVSDAQGNKRYTVTEDQWRRLRELAGVETRDGGQGVSDTKKTAQPPVKEKTRLFLTKAWGFTPETYPVLGFRNDGARNKFLRESDTDDWVVIAGTRTAQTDSNQRGRLLGMVRLGRTEVDVEQVLKELGTPIPPEHILEDGSYRWPRGLPMLEAVRFLTPFPDLKQVVGDYLPGSQWVTYALNVTEAIGQAEAKRISTLPSESAVIAPVPTLRKAKAFEDALSLGKKSGSGPPPSTIRAGSQREAGSASVYLLCLEGGPNAVWKVGYSRDVKRRLAELNNGLFSPATGYRFSLVKTQKFPEELQAHAFEQQLHEYLEKWRVPGENELYTVSRKQIERAWIDVFCSKHWA